MCIPGYWDEVMKEREDSYWDEVSHEWQDSYWEKEEEDAVTEDDQSGNHESAGRA